MTKTQNRFLYSTFYILLSTFYFLVSIACGPPPVENIYRKEGYFNGGINASVALLVSEWAGKTRILASGWLIDGGNGVLFSAKHFSDAFMDGIVELGGSECKVFLNGRVYDCIVSQVPPLRDAVVLKLSGAFDPANLPRPYKIAKEKVKIGDKVFVQGFHPHPREITRSNARDGLKDMIIPILKDFYELRTADPLEQREIVFDSLEARVVAVNARVRINTEEQDPLGELKFKANRYIKVITARNHKFSFGGLSGGVVVRIDEKGEAEAVGIVTSEKPVRFGYDKKGNLLSKAERVAIYDTMAITPIDSVKDLYEYARTLK
ncbi:MAG: hypothetical protein AAB799_01845 [Patescibacteria group bacterium]